MKKFTLFTLAALAALIVGCRTKDAGLAKSYYIDVHEFGPGNVTAAAVAEAHKKDLAKQGAHGVQFVDYWVDEERGRVYCLSEARNAESVVATHQEAHGLLPARVFAVASGDAVTRSGKGHLFLDVHQLGAGNVTAAAVAEAHKKDLAVQAQHGVRFINYWVDEAHGDVFCLSEAPNAEAIVETHRQAHGLLPTTVTPVVAAE